jgi:hypothetical protein
MRMCGAICEDVFDDAFGQFAVALILLHNDLDAGAGLDLATLLIRLHFRNRCLAAYSPIAQQSRFCQQYLKVA